MVAALVAVVVGVVLVWVAALIVAVVSNIASPQSSVAVIVITVALEVLCNHAVMAMEETVSVNVIGRALMESRDRVSGSDRRNAGRCTACCSGNCRSSHNRSIMQSCLLILWNQTTFHTSSSDIRLTRQF